MEKVPDKYFERTKMRDTGPQTPLPPTEEAAIFSPTEGGDLGQEDGKPVGSAKPNIQV